MYIPEPAVDATLRFIAKNAAPGSRIVFDYFLESGSFLWTDGRTRGWLRRLRLSERARRVQAGHREKKLG